MAFVITAQGPASTSGTMPVIAEIDGSLGFLFANSVPAGSTDAAAVLEALAPPGDKMRLRWIAKAASTDYTEAVPGPGWRRFTFGEADFEDVMRALAKEVFAELRAVGSTRNNASFLAGIQTRLAST